MNAIIKSYWLITFVLAILPVVSQAHINYTCNFNDIQQQINDTIIDGISYRLISFDGMRHIQKPGAPQLPCKIIRFSVPYNASDVSVEANCNNSITSSQLNYLIYPTQYSKSYFDATPYRLQIDSCIYLHDDYYPHRMAEITSHSFLSGENHIISIAIFPIQYNPVSGLIKYNPTISITINYNLTDNLSQNLLVRKDFSLRRQGWEDAKGYVVNPHQVELNASDKHLSVSFAGELHTLRIYSDTIPCEYMIVTSRELANSFARLAALKRQKGYATEIYCIEDILEDSTIQCGDSIPGILYPIKDNAGKLRQFLRNHFVNNSTQYVFLGSNIIPYRYGHLSSNHNYNIYDAHKNRIPTDLYYSNLLTNWNIDGDDYYGEASFYYNHHIYLNSNFDGSPHLSVGRLNAATPVQVDNYLNKLIKYELNPGTGSSSDYLGRAFIFHALNLNLDNLNDNYSHLFNSVDTINAFTQNNSNVGAYLIQNINSRKYGMISIQAHGEPTYWATSYDSGGQEESWLTSLDSYPAGINNENQDNNGLDNLDNKFSPNIIYSQGCTTMPFDNYYHPTLPSNQINCGDSFTLGSKYGGGHILDIREHLI